MFKANVINQKVMKNLEEIPGSDRTEYSSIIMKYKSDQGKKETCEKFPIPHPGFYLIFKSLISEQQNKEVLTLKPTLQLYNICSQHT